MFLSVCLPPPKEQEPRTQFERLMERVVGFWLLVGKGEWGNVPIPTAGVSLFTI